MHLKRAIMVYCKVGLRAFLGLGFFPFLNTDFLCVVFRPSQALTVGWPPTVSGFISFQFQIQQMERFYSQTFHQEFPPPLFFGAVKGLLQGKQGEWVAHPQKF